MASHPCTRASSRVPRLSILVFWSFICPWSMVPHLLNYLLLDTYMQIQGCLSWISVRGTWLKSISSSIIFWILRTLGIPDLISIMILRAFLEQFVAPDSNSDATSNILWIPRALGELNLIKWWANAISLVLGSHKQFYMHLVSCFHLLRESMFAWAPLLSLFLPHLQGLLRCSTSIFHVSSGSLRHLSVVSIKAPAP